jgi:hypothetical protein
MCFIFSPACPTKRSSQQPDRWWQDARFEIEALWSFAAVAHLIVLMPVSSRVSLMNRASLSNPKEQLAGTKLNAAAFIVLLCHAQTALDKRAPRARRPFCS